MLLVERTSCCHIANPFLSRWELIWPISRLKFSKMSKKAFLVKSSTSQWVKHAQLTIDSWVYQTIWKRKAHVILRPCFLFLKVQSSSWSRRNAIHWWHLEAPAFQDHEQFFFCQTSIPCFWWCKRGLIMPVVYVWLFFLFRLCRAKALWPSNMNFKLVYKYVPGSS